MKYIKVLEDVIEQYVLLVGTKEYLSRKVHGRLEEYLMKKHIDPAFVMETKAVLKDIEDNRVADFDNNLDRYGEDPFKDIDIEEMLIGDVLEFYKNKKIRIIEEVTLIGLELFIIVNSIEDEKDKKIKIVKQAIKILSKTDDIEVTNEDMKLVKETYEKNNITGVKLLADILTNIEATEKRKEDTRKRKFDNYKDRIDDIKNDAKKAADAAKNNAKEDVKDKGYSTTEKVVGVAGLTLLGLASYKLFQYFSNDKEIIIIED